MWKFIPTVIMNQNHVGKLMVYFTFSGQNILDKLACKFNWTKVRRCFGRCPFYPTNGNFIWDPQNVSNFKYRQDFYIISRIILFSPWYLQPIPAMINHRNGNVGWSSWLKIILPGKAMVKPLNHTNLLYLLLLMVKHSSTLLLHSMTLLLEWFYRASENMLRKRIISAYRLTFSSHHLDTRIKVPRILRD